MLCRSMAQKYSLNLSNLMWRGRRIGLKCHGERSLFSPKIQLYFFFWYNEEFILANILTVFWFCSAFLVHKEMDAELIEGVASRPSLLQKLKSVRFTKTNVCSETFINFEKLRPTMSVMILSSFLQVCWYHSPSAFGSGHRSRQYLPRTYR